MPSVSELPLYTMNAPKPKAAQGVLLYQIDF